MNHTTNKPVGLGRRVGAIAVDVFLLLVLLVILAEIVSAPHSIGHLFKVAPIVGYLYLLLWPVYLVGFRLAHFATLGQRLFSC